MYGAILNKGQRYYTDLGTIFKAIDNRQRDYNWLITDVMFNLKNELSAPCWMSGDELTAFVEKYGDMQWIWGDLNGFEKNITYEQVMEHPLPYADGNPNFWKNPIKPQHPLASVEIVAFDSSYTFIISKDASIVDAYKTALPLSEDLEIYNENTAKKLHMREIFMRVGQHGLIPVLTLSGEYPAKLLAGALCEAGLPVAEVTLRTEAAFNAIAAMTEAYPDMLVGAGTVLNEYQAEQAVKAGAKFLVSPGFNPNVVGWCVENNVPIAPGCSTPSEIEAAMEFGLETVKFFPAEASGGIPMLKSLSAPYPMMRFIPTGGINADNMVDYLRCKNVLACGGSFMVNDKYLSPSPCHEFDGEALKANIKSVLMKMYGFRLAHIGVNLADEEEARKASALSEAMFGFAPTEGALGIMCGKQFEFMKGPYFGEYGHIAITTNFIERAIEYFKRMGFEFEKNGILYGDYGIINAAYFKQNFFGCAIHLLRG